MLEICDLVHMLHVERIERRVLGERQAVLQLSLGLGIDVDLPSVQEAWDGFDTAINGDITTDIDPDKADLLLALGFRR